MDSIQRSVVLLVGDCLAEAADVLQERYRTAIQPFEAELAALCQTHDLTEKQEAEFSDPRVLEALLRALVRRANPPAASLIRSAQHFAVDAGTHIYLVVQTWGESAVKRVRALLRAIHRVSSEYAFDTSIDCVAVLPGVLDNTSTDEMAAAARAFMKALEETYETRGAEPWGDNPPFSASWVVDGTDANGRDLIGGGRPAPLIARVLEILILRSPGLVREQLPSTDADGTNCLRSLGAIQVSVPTRSILAEIKRHFAAHAIQRRLRPNESVFLEEATLHAKAALQSSIDLELLFEALHSNENGNLLSPFRPPTDGQKGSEYHATLKRYAVRYRDSAFDTACSRLYPNARSLSARTSQSLCETLAQSLDIRDVGTRQLLAVADVILDEDEESSFVTDSRRRTEKYSLDTMRKKLLQLTCEKLAFRQEESSADEKRLEIEELKAARDSLTAAEEDLEREESERDNNRENGSDAVAQTRDVRRKVAQLEEAISRKLEELAKLQERDRVIESLWMGPEGVNRLQGYLEADTQEAAVRFEEEAQLLEARDSDARREYDAIVGGRAKHLVRWFLLAPASAVLLLYLAGVALFLGKAISASDLLTGWLPRAVLGALVVYLVIVGGAFLYRFTLRMDRLHRIMQECSVGIENIRVRAHELYSSSFQRLFDLRVLEQLADLLEDARCQVRELHDRLLDAHKTTMDILASDSRSDQGPNSVDPTEVYLIPVSAYGQVVNDVGRSELDSLCDRYFSTSEASLSVQLLRGVPGAKGLYEDLLAFGESQFEPAVESMSLENLLTLPYYENLRRRYGITWLALDALLSDVAPFIQIQRVAGGTTIATIRSVGIAKVEDSVLREKLRQSDGFGTFFANSDSSSVLAVVATGWFGLEEILVLKTQA